MTFLIVTKFALRPFFQQCKVRSFIQKPVFCSIWVLFANMLGAPRKLQRDSVPRFLMQEKDDKR